MRLVGGAVAENGRGEFGRLEVFHAGVWGRVCRTAFGGASITPASVAGGCQQLATMKDGTSTGLASWRPGRRACRLVRARCSAAATRRACWTAPALSSETSLQGCGTARTPSAATSTCSAPVMAAQLQVRPLDINICVRFWGGLRRRPWWQPAPSILQCCFCQARPERTE